MKRKKTMLPGFYFCPTDAELVVHYLQKKAAGLPLDCEHIIPYSDLVYRTEPWLLSRPEDHTKSMFFFTTRPRRQRQVGTGSWKKSNEEVVKVDGIVVAKKMNMAFNRKSRSTGWIMHEFLLVQDDDDKSNNSKKNELVLCQIRLNPTATKRRLEEMAATNALQDQALVRPQVDCGCCSIAGEHGLPPGFHFAPTDQELVIQYLQRRAAGLQLNCHGIIDDSDQVYSVEPWNAVGDPWDITKPRYLFTQRPRRQRQAGAGSWKKNEEEAVRVGDAVVGKKVLLTFHRNNGNRKATGWVMREYLLTSTSENNDGNNNELVLCRIKFNPSAEEKAAAGSKRKRSPPEIEETQKETIVVPPAPFLNEGHHQLGNDESCWGLHIPPAVDYDQVFRLTEDQIFVDLIFYWKPV